MTALVDTANVLKNPIAKELTDLGVINPPDVELYYPHVRDREDVAVYRCKKSGVIFLSSNDHLDNSYYENFDGTSYWDTGSGVADIKQMDEDDERRVAALEKIIADKNLSGGSYLDVGCGKGAVLRALAGIKDKSGVELQVDTVKHLSSLGLLMYQSLDAVEITQKQFDIVTLFHVFEHLTQPLEILKQVRRLVKPGGLLIMEVPHARDVLFETYDLDAFKKFALWSEHIILHTRDSLQSYLKVAGFQRTVISGLQRYPLANHLHWLWKGKPGGHRILTSMRDPALERMYAERLVAIDQTDTLWTYSET